MAVFKAQIFINQGKWGWSETYWVTSGTSGSSGNPNNASGTFALAETAINRLINKRVTLMNPANEVQGYRLTMLDADLVTPVATTLVQTNFAPTGTFGTVNIGPWMGVTTTVKNAADTYQQTRILRGLDDTSFTFNKNGSGKDITPAWLALYTSWNKFLTNQTAQIASLQGWSYGAVVNNKDKTARKIGAVTVVTFDPTTGQAILTVTQLGTFPLPVFAPGDRVRVAKLKGVGVHGLGGETVIVKAGVGSAYTIAKLPRCPGLIAILTNPGIIYNHPKIFVQYGDWETGRIIKRDTGKAFFVTRGRASGVKC